MSDLMLLFLYINNSFGDLSSGEGSVLYEYYF
jgi:hypothetical protein